MRALHRARRWTACWHRTTPTSTIWSWTAGRATARSICCGLRRPRALDVRARRRPGRRREPRLAAASAANRGLSQRGRHLPARRGRARGGRVRGQPGPAWSTARRELVDDGGTGWAATRPSRLRSRALARGAPSASRRRSSPSRRARARRGLDWRLQFALDYDLWIRLAPHRQAAASWRARWRVVGMRPDNKTLGRPRQRLPGGDRGGQAPASATCR